MRFASIASNHTAMKFNHTTDIDTTGRTNCFNPHKVLNSLHSNLSTGNNFLGFLEHRVQVEFIATQLMSSVYRTH